LLTKGKYQKTTSRKVSATIAGDFDLDGGPVAVLDDCGLAVCEHNGTAQQVAFVAFNTAEGWSRDVSDDIAAELAQARASRGEMPLSVADFIADHTRLSRVRRLGE
jgi:hypothetical protein